MIILNSQDIGLILDVLPKQTARPRGIARIRVRMNKRQVTPNPSKRIFVASEKLMEVADNIIILTVFCAADFAAAQLKTYF